MDKSGNKPNPGSQITMHHILPCKKLETSCDFKCFFANETYSNAHDFNFADWLTSNRV